MNSRQAATRPCISYNYGKILPLLEYMPLNEPTATARAQLRRYFFSFVFPPFRCSHDVLEARGSLQKENLVLISVLHRHRLGQVHRTTNRTVCTLVRRQLTYAPQAYVPVQRTIDALYSSITLPPANDIYDQVAHIAYIFNQMSRQAVTRKLVSDCSLYESTPVTETLSRLCQPSSRPQHIIDSLIVNRYCSRMSPTARCIRGAER
ncbi:hypothetical protein F4808DRAFT_428374 [Astrocystis sublimbata]|nr:hypothetical protein F4808DRAFT_428374 [Astrocystis sublimbata]